MGNGLSYRVPPFQRDYSWTVNEWEDLWLDIIETIGGSGEPAHYMGYIVLQAGDDRSYVVIDGQQRLTTMSLIVLAVLKNLQRLVESGMDPEKNQSRLDQIMQSYIASIELVTLEPRPKLTLNRNNDLYYRSYIVPLVALPRFGFRASEQALREAFEWFDRQVEEHIRQRGGDAGVHLISFVEEMSDRLFFTVITVTDELNAYKVFETLNARGVRLSSTDLLKNYLFSVMNRVNPHPRELELLEERWEALAGRLGEERFPEYLRVQWNSLLPSVRQADLFKTIRRRITTGAGVIELMRDLETDLDTYLALTSPERSDWPRESKAHARLLLVLGARQSFSLLLAVRRHADQATFDRVLRACVVIAVRYNVIGGQPPGEQEAVYHSVVRDGVTGELTEAAGIIGRLNRIYPGDPLFRTAFASKLMRTTHAPERRIVRYLLCQIERHLGGADLDFESDAFTIEHIFPLNPDQNWGAFSDLRGDSIAFRLGNMTLLETGRNRELGNVDYPAKRAVYEQSAFAMTRLLATEYAEWNAERLEARQQWMARQATAIWRIDQLSELGG